MYAYGPVPSRRLGKSIGVSPIPAKVCSYSCVYCQLGRTSTLQAKRQRFFPKEEILQDTEKVVSSESADVITFAGDGEPTLCSDLGWLIRKCKQKFDIPVAVITNGSLFFDEDVRSDLLAADIILPTLDAGNSETFRRINRPHKLITFDKMAEGLSAFRKEYDGQLWLEIMLVKGVNDADEQLTMLRDSVMEIQPDRLFIMTPLRPPAESWVKCPTSKRIKAAKQLFSDAVTVVNREDGNFGIAEFANAAEAILEISARHPLRLGQARVIEGKFAEQGVIDRLIQESKIALNRYHRIDYLYSLKPKTKPSPRYTISPKITVKRFNCCTYRVMAKSEDRGRRYQVVLADAYYDTLARGLVSKEQLLKLCFEYFVNNHLLDQLATKFVLREICTRLPKLEEDIKKAIVKSLS